jgi:MFS transporter, MHS family, alpha-ketoglutarate permease
MHTSLNSHVCDNTIDISDCAHSEGVAYRGCRNTSLGSGRCVVINSSCEEGAWTSSAVGLVILPGFGVLSDRLGRKPMLIAACVGNLAISYPAFLLVGDGFLQLLGFQLLAVFFLASYLASLAATMAEKLPPEVGTTGIVLPYAISVGVFGGTAPYILTAMKENGLLRLIWIYPALMAIICFTRMEETAHNKMD